MSAPAPILDRPFTVYQHQHKYVLLIVDNPSREFPFDLDQTIEAVCVVRECGSRLTQAQIEDILDDAQ